MNWQDSSKCWSFCRCRQFHKCVCYRKKCDSEKSSKKIVPVPEITRFVYDCAVKLGIKNEHAKIFADNMVTADSRGIYSHGLNRLEHYIKDIKAKQCKPNAKPKILYECKSTAAVCGQYSLGSVIGRFCMDLAMKKASNTGIGMVVTNGSNHFGVNSYYTNYAVSRGFIGLTFSNTSPMMVPTGAKDATLGTNPISFAAPGENGDSVVIDFATTAVAFGKIEMHNRKKLKIPLGWALDSNGKPTDDPVVAMKSQRLTPLGYGEGHKGTGLALMVEMFCGILGDAAWGPHIEFWGKKPTRPANLAQCFIAINPQKFSPGFEKRLSALLCCIRNLEPKDPTKPVLIPGDIERKIMKKIDKQGGIEYTTSHVEMFERLTKELEKSPSIVPVPEITRFVYDCMVKLGVKNEQAKTFAESLVIADYRGIYSHGLNRLGSNHFGLNSYYTTYAVGEGFIGMTFTNTSPIMVPTGAKQAILGTNPLSIAAPAENGDSIVVDFATTAVAFGKIEMFRRKKMKLPLGWALDSNGKPTDDPDVAIKSRKLAPVGGNESHKGTGLGLMVEILCGILGDAAWGPHIRSWGQKPAKPANLGHCFIAVDPHKFCPGFEKRLSELLCLIRNLEPVDPKRPVIIPGDMEREIMKKTDKQGGIEYTPSHVEMFERVTKELGVKPIKFAC